MMTSSASLKRYLDAKKKVIDEALDRFLAGEDCYPPVIFQAMRYSIFAGGKRIRPVLCLAAAEAGGQRDAAAAVFARCLRPGADPHLLPDS